ncbi:UPF0669 protein C6orf120 homolog [Danio aesculapii]|uniref:UPF0669 protein C6orf120 homolog n=1 Tax=Danio aesculapii TaxID=1142201 RepID=UPI0024C087CD|nr:UPF0669 protein C6orf120 homolog [Danio aesculapii]
MTASRHGGASSSPRSTPVAEHSKQNDADCPFPWSIFDNAPASSRCSCCLLAVTMVLFWAGLLVLAALSQTLGFLQHSEEPSVPGEWVLLHVVQGHIGAGNYSYLRLNHEGRIILHMQSLKGDADLYVSDKTLRPNFDTYKLQSTTCGQDVVVVPGDFLRPVGIGIYGHPSYMESEFEMKVFYDQKALAESEIEKNSYSSDETPGQPRQSQGPEDTEEEEESILWTILIGILKIILEILF